MTDSIRQDAGKEPQLSLSVLVTREEYMAFNAQLQRSQRSGRVSLLSATGAVLTAAGIAGLFFGGNISLAPAVAVCVLLFGLFLACFNSLVAPLLDKAAAAREYDEKEDLRLSNVYVFTEAAVEIRNGRMEGSRPLRLATGWMETADLFSLSFGRECHIVVPKRLLNEGQMNGLRQLLKTSGSPSA